MYISKSPSAQDTINSGRPTRRDGAGHRRFVGNLNLILISNISNVLLLVLKIIMVGFSTKKSMIASLVDSLLDCLFGFGVSFAVKYSVKNFQFYFLGTHWLKNAVIFFLASCCALLAALNIDDDVRELVSDGATKFYSLERKVAIPGFVMIIVVKSLLFLLCRSDLDPYVKVMGKDHLTDVAANVLPLVVFISGNRSPWWLDGSAGLLLNTYVASVWYHQMYDSFVFLRMKSDVCSFVFRGLDYSLFRLSSTTALIVVKFSDVSVDVLEVIRVLSSHPDFIGYDNLRILFSFIPTEDFQVQDESTPISLGVTRKRKLETILEEDDESDEKRTRGSDNII